MSPIRFALPVKSPDMVSIAAKVLQLVALTALWSALPLGTSAYAAPREPSVAEETALQEAIQLMRDNGANELADCLSKAIKDKKIKIDPALSHEGLYEGGLVIFNDRFFRNFAKGRESGNRRIEYSALLQIAYIFAHEKRHGEQGQFRSGVSFVFWKLGGEDWDEAEAYVDQYEFLMKVLDRWVSLWESQLKTTKESRNKTEQKFQQLQQRLQEIGNDLSQLTEEDKQLIDELGRLLDQLLEALRRLNELLDQYREINDGFQDVADGFDNPEDVNRSDLGEKVDELIEKIREQIRQIDSPLRDDTDRARALKQQVENLQEQISGSSSDSAALPQALLMTLVSSDSIADLPEEIEVLQTGNRIRQDLVSIVQSGVEVIESEEGLSRFGPAQAYFRLLAEAIISQAPAPHAVNVEMTISPSPVKDYLPPMPFEFGLSIEGEDALPRIQVSDQSFESPSVGLTFSLAAVEEAVNSSDLGAILARQLDTGEVRIALDPDSSVPSRVSIEEAIDINDDLQIDDSEIENAIALWITGEQVPGTNQTITDSKILFLIRLWITGSEITTAAN